MLATSRPVAQWLERPTGVRKVTGSIPVGDADFFIVPRSRHVEYSNFSYQKHCFTFYNLYMITSAQPISVQHFDALYPINCLKLCKVTGALKHREIVG